MKHWKALLLASVLPWLSATPARAEFFISPNLGLAIGGFLKDGAKVTFGGQLGVLGASAVGFEGDYGYTAQVRGGHGTDNFRTISGALLIAPSRFGSAKWRPYAAVGGGLIGAVYKVQHIVSVGGDEVESLPVISAGAGVFGFFSKRFGVRFDARYFRVMDDYEPPPGITATAPHFVRASGGLVIRF